MSGKKKKKLPTANSGKISGKPARGRVENLRPFQPGQSGNPSGRPKRRPVSEAYSAGLSAELPTALRRQLNLPVGSTWAEAVAAGTIRSAVKGNHAASRELREALEGKSTQRLELTGESGGPIEAKISLGNTLALIREAYGITHTGDRPNSADDGGAPAQPAETVPVSETVAVGPGEKETGEKE
jgi:Family of unknown function (DUF5681)